MKGKYIGLALVAVIWAFSAFITLQKYPFNLPFRWPAPAYDFKRNPWTPAKINLGRVLFYDTRLSKNNTISCASCHSPYTAFTHSDHALSHGIDDRIGTRNSPALMNLAWHSEFMWDGAINHLDMQALAPITHPDEMGEEIGALITKLNQIPIYKSLTFQAYKDSSLTGERLLKSLSQFMLTLVSANAKYDSVMRQQAGFTSQELNGYRLFQKNCASCHAEPLFTNLSFENNGLPVDPLLNDFGKMKVTHLPADSLKFKVPTLRNIEFSQPYMHDGRFKKLSEVINHYASAPKSGPTLAKQLKTNMALTSNEKVDLIAFLLTLSDRSFLFNRENAFPQELLNEF